MRLPTVAVHTVGAGGGSIVGLDEGGALRIGPESAGAEPGPACYGRGGTQADGQRRQPPPRPPARRAPGRDRARPRGGGARARRHRPRGVVDVVNAEMVRALRVVSVEQGLDPRDFALVAFGGAGPLHACALAEELAMDTVLVPAAAGVLSAFGLVAADERRDAVRSYVQPLEEAGELPRDGEADLRYAGQSFELPSRSARASPSGSTRRTRRATATRIEPGRSSSSPSEPPRCARRPRSRSPAPQTRRRALGARAGRSDGLGPRGLGGRDRRARDTRPEEKRVIDVELQVLGAALRAIAEEMGAALVRSAFSANIKERRDCSTALFDERGPHGDAGRAHPRPPRRDARGRGRGAGARARARASRGS